MKKMRTIEETEKVRLVDGDYMEIIKTEQPKVVIASRIPDSVEDPSLQGVLDLLKERFTNWSLDRPTDEDPRDYIGFMQSSKENSSKITSLTNETGRSCISSSGQGMMEIYTPRGPDGKHYSIIKIPSDLFAEYGDCLSRAWGITWLDFRNAQRNGFDRSSDELVKSLQNDALVGTSLPERANDTIESALGLSQRYFGANEGLSLKEYSAEVENDIIDFKNLLNRCYDSIDKIADFMENLKD
jgi:hypothetical protein